MPQHKPSTVQEIVGDFLGRRDAILRALTEDKVEFYEQCDPDKDNLALYGHPEGEWEVTLPAEEVPAELPEPCLGINFARDGMDERDWLALVAVHSDAWLMAVAFYYGSQLNAQERRELFTALNAPDTLYEIITEKATGTQKRRRRMEFQHDQDDPGKAQASKEPLPSGRLVTDDDVPHLKGRSAELYWPPDRLWYLVEILTVNPKKMTANIKYTNGDEEELDLNEVIDEGHMSLLT
jgi:hypothetical protein